MTKLEPLSSIKHVHSFRKVAGKLYCIHPSCFRRYSQTDMHCSLVKCTSCNTHFIYDMAKYGTKDLQIACYNCNPKLPYHPTLEQQKQLLGDILLSQLNASLQCRYEDLHRKLAALEKQETEFRIFKDRLLEKRDALELAGKKLQEQRNHLAQMYKVKRAKLKLTKVEPEEAITPLLPDSLTPGDILVAELAKLLGEKPQ